jgi:2-polyprenyl-3-methyl-5-hydroxy-6-metoxy-1,4-benzoquinol methylase
MTIPPSKIQQDFDRLALLSGDEWNHNNHYDAYLLKQLPASSELDALEIGCGAGSFARLLARRFKRVHALDLSPRMIEVAKERSRDNPNIDFQVADVMAQELPAGQFGCVVSIATLHHLPLDAMLLKMKNALAPGGTLLVLDIFKAESLGDFSMAALAMPINLLLRLVKTGRLMESAEVRAAWEEHGRTDVYPTLSQVRQVCGAILPGARVTRHLLWRYSIVWTKNS